MTVEQYDTTFPTTFKTARVDQVCEHCNTVIPKGCRVFLVVGKVEGKMQTQKFHTECLVEAMYIQNEKHPEEDVMSSDEL